MQRLFALALGNGAGAVAQPRGQFLATVPEEPEDDEEPAGAAGGQGDCMHEHLAGDAVTQAGFCRDHRGKLQSVWELREDDADVADHEDEGGGEDEADRASRAAAAEPPGDPNVGVSRAAAQAQRTQAGQEYLLRSTSTAQAYCSGVQVLSGRTSRRGRRVLEQYLY